MVNIGHDPHVAPVHEKGIVKMVGPFPHALTSESAGFRMIYHRVFSFEKLQYPLSWGWHVVTGTILN